MSSPRKPFLRRKKSRIDFFRAPVRYLQESESPESVFEKPYRDREYIQMHLEPNLAAIQALAGPPLEFACSAVDNECVSGIQCIAGASILIEGPLVAQAGYLTPEASAGEIAGWEVSGDNSRIIDITLAEGYAQHIIEVVYVDGYGINHSQEITINCECYWKIYFDNTRWEIDNNGTWEGNYWKSDNGSPKQLTLSELGTWVNGYRPSKIKLTHSVGVGIDYIIVRDKQNNNMYLDNTGNYTPGKEVDLTWYGAGSANDIDYIGLADAAEFTVTDIEFCEEGE